MVVVGLNGCVVASPHPADVVDVVVKRKDWLFFCSWHQNYFCYYHELQCLLACLPFNILLLMRVSATAAAGIAVSFAYWKHNNLFTILSQKIVLGKHIFPLESSWRLFEIFRLPNFYEQFLITIWSGESKIGTKLRKLQESCFAFPQLWVCSRVTYYTSYGKTHLVATSSACFSLRKS